MAELYTPTEDELTEGQYQAKDGSYREITEQEARRAIARIKLQAAAAAHIEFQEQMNANLPSIVREMRAQGWDQGRASIAADLTNPMQQDGTRQTTQNPYRDPIPTTGADDT